VRGVAYGRSYLLRMLTRLPPQRRARLQRLAGGGDVMITGTPPTSGLLLRDVRLDHVQAWDLVRGVLEQPVAEAFRRHVGPGSVVWDVGANVGYFSLLAARLGATVHAYEPVPENVRAIRGNVAANGFDERVEVHPVAVAASAGRAGLLVVEDPSWSHLADRGRHPRTRHELEVDVVTLDGLGLPAPDLVKIDVEGSEVAVLQGARELLARARPVLIVELHETNAEVCDLLEGAGYAVENLDGPEPPRAAGPVHILARPR
jgi:FkbM family methyltransferase